MSLQGTRPPKCGGLGGERLQPADRSSAHSVHENFPMVLSHCRPTWLAAFGLIACSLPWCANASEPPAPVTLIFDTGIGNDVDDALALGVIHALQAHGHCELLAVTITKDHALAAPFVDAINTFYGRGEVPIGTVRDGVTPAQGEFLGSAEVPGGYWLRYRRNLEAGAAEDAIRGPATGPAER